MDGARPRGADADAQPPCVLGEPRRHESRRFFVPYADETDLILTLAQRLYDGIDAIANDAEGVRRAPTDQGLDDDVGRVRIVVERGRRLRLYLALKLADRSAGRRRRPARRARPPRRRLGRNRGDESRPQQLSGVHVDVLASINRGSAVEILESGAGHPPSRTRRPLIAARYGIRVQRHSGWSRARDGEIDRIGLVIYPHEQWRFRNTRKNPRSPKSDELVAGSARPFNHCKSSSGTDREGERRRARRLAAEGAMTIAGVERCGLKTIADGSTETAAFARRAHLAACSGFPLRLVEANSSSCFSLIDFSI